MDQRDLLFLVITLILVTTLIVTITRFVRARRGKSDNGRNWWEGPWDDDRKG